MDYCGQRPAEELKRKINSLYNYINNLKPSSEYEKVLIKLYKDIKECIRLTEYQKNICSNSWQEEISLMLQTFNECFSGLQEAYDLEDIKRVFSDFMNFKDRYIQWLQRLSSYSLQELGIKFNRGDEDVYKLSIPTINTIASSIQSDKELNIFDPQVFSGENLKQLSELCTCKLNTYGLEQEKYGFATAKDNIDRVIKGSLKGSIISHDFFDIINITPRISITTEIKADGSLIITNENNLLRNSMQYLKNNGLFIFNIPFYCLTPEMLLFMAKWLRDISIFKHDIDNNTAKYITIMGIKNFNPSYADVFETLILLNYDNISSELNKEYEIDTAENNELKLFRGSILDESELDEIIINDGLYSEFYNSIQIQDNYKDSKPLLPFNIGQIGLILSSGCLDGVVEEFDGVKHVIKGMTIKQTDRNTETTVNNKGETVIDSTTIVSNRVQISAFGADGTFYTLV